MGGGGWYIRFSTYYEGDLCSNSCSMTVSKLPSGTFFSPCLSLHSPCQCLDISIQVSPSAMPVSISCTICLSAPISPCTWSNCSILIGEMGLQDFEIAKLNIIKNCLMVCIKSSCLFQMLDNCRKTWMYTADR